MNKTTMRKVEGALAFAHLLALPVGKAAPLKPKPTAAARPAPTTVKAAPKQIAAKAAPVAAPAPRRYSFAHLAGASVEGPILPTASAPAASKPMPATSKPDWHAAAASWAKAFDRARARGLIA
jgi:hypothetical protein